MNMNRWAEVLHHWADAVRSKFDDEGGVTHGYWKDICCFLDGTLRPINRPGEPSSGLFSDFQRLFYSGYKKRHGLQFQGVVAPNGLFIDLFGPVPGRHNDLHLAAQSAIVRRLRSLFRNAVVNMAYRCMGDSIYHLSTSIVRSIQGYFLSAAQKRENTIVSRQRTCVEQAFGFVVRDWKYVDIRVNQRILQSSSGVARAYRVAVLLTNFMSCKYSNQICLKFGCSPPSLADYLAGGVESQNSVLA